MHRTAQHNGSGLAAVFLRAACDRLRDETIGPHLDGFVDELRATGYRSLTIRQYVGPVVHFGVWLARRRVELADVDDDVTQQFIAHLSACRCRRRHRVRRCGRSKTVGIALRAFLGHLRRHHIVALSPVIPAFKIVEEFEVWMRQHRGSAPRTLRDYRRHVAPLVVAHKGRGWRRLDAKWVRAYVLDRRKVTTTAVMLVLIRALRMFVRFLVASGRCPSHLDRAVPSVPHWKLATLPRYLAAENVERVIDKCSASTPVATRDRAVLLLLARLGLRAGEVRNLRLVDLDWPRGRLCVVGKSRRPAWLPLAQDVGDALLGYLRRRPACAVPQVFLCADAPYRRLSDTGVGGICERAIVAAGVTSPNHGAHVFRHSAATTLIRHGASLDDVGRLLRHQSRESTAIYAKVAFSALGRIAQPWPGST